MFLMVFLVIIGLGIALMWWLDKRKIEENWRKRKEEREEAARKIEEEEPRRKREEAARKIEEEEPRRKREEAARIREEEEAPFKKHFFEWIHQEGVDVKCEQCLSRSFYIILYSWGDGLSFKGLCVKCAAEKSSSQIQHPQRFEAMRYRTPFPFQEYEDVIYTLSGGQFPYSGACIEAPPLDEEVQKRYEEEEAARKREEEEAARKRYEEEAARKREEEKARFKKHFFEWISQEGVDVKCERCLSRSFYITYSWGDDGLSFQGRCVKCAAEKRSSYQIQYPQRFEAMRYRTPFPFQEYRDVIYTLSGGEYPYSGAYIDIPPLDEEMQKRYEEEKARIREEAARKREEEEAPFKKHFFEWLNQEGIDVKCEQCLSRFFYITWYSWMGDGLSFEGRCVKCAAKNSFKAMRHKTPFPFKEYRDVICTLSGGQFPYSGAYIDIPPLDEEMQKRYEEEAARKREEEEAPFKKHFFEWISQEGIDVKCEQCLSRSFYIILNSWMGDDLSFEGRCVKCAADKWFEAMRHKTPFPFWEYKDVIDTLSIYGGGACIEVPPLDEEMQKRYEEEAARKREEEKVRKREEEARFKKHFFEWLNQEGIDVECGRCLSRSFYIISYAKSNGLSFQGQCAECEAKKWFKAMRHKTPFPFKEHGNVISSLRSGGVYINIPPLEEAPLDEEVRSRSISKSVRQEVWRRDEGQCVECGSQEDLEYDHIIPHSKGGANTLRNVQLLCEHCNRTKHAKI